VSLSPAEREQRRLAANERWSKQDPGPFMAKVRDGQIQKWRLQVIAEADGLQLSQAEIARRIDCKRRAHQNRMTLAAMAARKARV
jgi:hypothetical protein